MPDENEQPAETTGTEQPAANTEPTPETGKDGTPFDAARAQRTIEQQRDELKQLRTAAKEAETLKAKVTEYEREKMSESERQAAELADLKAKNAALETQYQNALIRTAIEREASKAGAIDPEVVYALVDRSEIAFDDDGRVKGAGKVVKALLEAKPYLVAQESTGGARGVQPTGRAGQPAGRDALIEAADKRLAGSGRYAPL